MTGSIGTGKSLVPCGFVNQRVEGINPVSDHINIGIKGSKKAAVR